MEMRKRVAILERTKANDAKFHLDLMKGTITVNEVLKNSAETV